MKSRKTHRANIEKTVPFFFRVGLIVSMSLAIVAFEWKTPYEIYEDEEEGTEIEVDQTIAPITYRMDKPIELPEEDTEKIKDTHEPYLMASEVAPIFPGGDTAFKEYLEINIEYPRAAKEINLNGKVYVSFIVTQTGSIKDIKLLKDIGGGCGEEAVRVIRQMPIWIPGRQGGENVNVQMKMCLNFGLL